MTGPVRRIRAVGYELPNFERLRHSAKVTDLAIQPASFPLVRTCSGVRIVSDAVVQFAELGQLHLLPEADAFLHGEMREGPHILM